GEELLDVGDVFALEGKLKFIFDADGPSFRFRFTLRDLSVRLRFHRDVVRKGEVVLGPDGPIGIRPVIGDDTADLVILPPTIVIDSEKGLDFPDFSLEDDQLVEVPPMLIVWDDEPQLGLLVKKLKIDLSSTTSFSEVLSHGYDESWRGVFFEELAIFGLDAVFPELPKKADPNDPGQGLVVDARNWFIGTEGIAGSLRVAMTTATGIFHGLAFEIELDRGNLLRATGEVTLKVESLSNEFVSLGPNGDLVIAFTLRVAPGGGLLTELVLRTPRKKDDKGEDLGLFTLKDDVADVFPFALLILGLATGIPEEANIGLWILNLFTLVGWFDFKALTLDDLKLRQRAEPLAGRELRWIDFVLDVKLKVALDIPIGSIVLLLPDIKTKPGHPISVLLHGFTLSWATNRDEFSATELGDRPGFELSLDPQNAVSFEIGDETIIENAPLVLTKIGIGRWEQGMWFDIGFKMSQNFSDLSFSVVPLAIRVWVLTDGSIDRVTFSPASFSVLVPKIIYARGEWQAGDVTRISGRALILGWGASVLDSKDPKNWMLNVGFGMREQALPPPPEDPRVTSRILAFDFESASGIPAVILPGTSIYGISGLHAEHARPALGGGSPAQWLTQRPPQYQVDMDKWEAAEGSSGWGAGVVLGSSVDHGRPWNLKAGFMSLEPGPVLMLFGTANFVKQRKGVKDTDPASLAFFATLDMERHEFLLGVRYEKKVPDGTGRVLKLVVPAELFLNNQGWHLYVGQDKPFTRFVSAEILGRYAIAGYLMFDTATIADVAGTGTDVPGFAVALGARFAYEGGHKGKHYKLVYFLKVEADLALSLATPSLMLLRARLAGGLVAKAWGLGFELELSAEFLWIRPSPEYLHGVLKATLDLPWPIPNLHLSIDKTKGDDGDGEPITGSLVDGLSLYL
ncbi:MAG: hypothetical protein LC713_04275, partial [Actinobacteria bacterium]|nr:hypothetical protein [Actinomycetota bacterium]